MKAPRPRGKCDICQMKGSVAYSGVPGILARMEKGKVPAGGYVCRCDTCKRYATDEEAFEELVRRGLADRRAPVGT